MNPIRFRPQGFTLIELLISTTVAMIVFAGVVAAFITVQGTYHQEASTKGVIEGGRAAQAYLEKLVPYAGYGLSPALAFNFTTAPPTGIRDNAALGGGATTDDVAFRYRDPYFSRPAVVNAAGTSLTLTGTFGTPLRTGQLVLLICAGATEAAFFRLSADVAPADTTVAVAAAAIPGLVNSANPCLTTAGAQVTLVHEKRLRVVELGGRPNLVIFHDHDPASTNFDPIAVDVENFQVAYVMNRPNSLSVCCAGTAPVAGNWVVGDAGDAAPSVPTAQVPAPAFNMIYDDPARFTLDPGNIRSLRLSLTVRSRVPDTQGRLVSPRPALENFVPAAATLDGYYRTTVTTAVRLPNMTSRSMFAPPTGGAPNFSGG